MPTSGTLTRTRRHRPKSAELYRMLRAANAQSVQPIRVQMLGAQAATTNPGGGEIQAAATCRALQQLGVDVRSVAEPAPNREAPGTEFWHLFGSRPEFLGLVRQAAERRARVVLSPVAWFDVVARWRECGPLHQRLLGCASLLARRMFPALPDWRRRLYQSADLLLPNSQSEAHQLQSLLDVPPARIKVVPNGADERFAHATSELFFETYGIRDFVLYAGRIEPRKNQLGFLKAMRGSDVPIVVLGDAVPGYRWYYDRCRDAAEENVHFLPRFAHDSSLLASAYAACRCLALTSWFETPGLVTLEAAMSGTPVVVTSRGSAREYFGDLVSYVDPRSTSEIRRSVLHAWQSPRSEQLRRHVQGRFTWTAVARATWEAYQSVV